MDYATKDEILSSRLKASGMKVPLKRQRFPMVEGIQAKVTLRSKLTGTYMNIGFIAGIDNKINGNIADRLLDDYPDIFEVIKVNEMPIMKGKKDQERDQMANDIITKLKDEYDFVPKEKKSTARERSGEPSTQKTNEGTSKK